MVVSLSCTCPFLIPSCPLSASKAALGCTGERSIVGGARKDSGSGRRENKSKTKVFAQYARAASEISERREEARNVGRYIDN